MEAVLAGPMGRILLGPGEVTIGCDADNSLIISDLGTAAHHALVRPDGQGYAIIDLGSEYGTIVNGRWLEPEKARPLLPGDVIQIGDTRLTFEVFQNAAAIPTALPGVDAGSSLSAVGYGRRNAEPPVSPPQGVDIADQDTGWINRPLHSKRAAAATSLNAGISSLRSLLSQSRSQQPPYTSQPWVAGGTTTYPPQQQLWRQDRRLLYLVLATMLAILLIVSLISLIISRPTPDRTLDTFCNALLAGNGELAANQLSTKLQDQQGSFLIATLVVSKISTCAHTAANVSGSSATATLTLTFPPNSGAVNSQSRTLVTLVTLIQEANGAWKIDALQSQ